MNNYMWIFLKKIEYKFPNIQANISSKVDAMIKSPPKP